MAALNSSFVIPVQAWVVLDCWAGLQEGSRGEVMSFVELFERLCSFVAELLRLWLVSLWLTVLL